MSAPDSTPPDAGGRQEFRTVEPRTRGQLRILRVGDVELDIDGHQIRVRGALVRLPHKEFLILWLLMDNAGRVVSRRAILDSAWDSDRPDDKKILEVHIRRLRRRIELDPDAPDHIRTVRGVGYIYDLPGD